MKDHSEFEAGLGLKSLYYFECVGVQMTRPAGPAPIQYALRHRSGPSALSPPTILDLGLHERPFAAGQGAWICPKEGSFVCGTWVAVRSGGGIGTNHRNWDKWRCP